MSFRTALIQSLTLYPLHTYTGHGRKQLIKQLKSTVGGY